MIFDTQIRKARKNHLCTWCGENILPSESYACWVSVEDSFFSNKMHIECHEATEKLNEEYTPYENQRGKLEDE